MTETILTVLGVTAIIIWIGGVIGLTAIAPSVLKEDEFFSYAMDIDPARILLAVTLGIIGWPALTVIGLMQKRKER